MFSKYAFDTQRIEGAVWPMMNQFLPNIVYSAGTVAILLFMNWRLALALVLIVPLYGLIRVRFHTRMRKSNREIRLAQERLAGTATEYIAALRLVRSFGEEEQVGSHLDASSRNYAERRVELATISMMFGTFSYVTAQALGLVVVAGGAVLAIQGKMTMGTLTAFVSALPVIMMPIQMIAHLGEQYFTGQEGYQSLRELLDVEQVEKWKGTEKPGDMNGGIEFEGVTFTYDGATRPAVRDFTLRINPGEHVAFAGPSGAGKSTLVNLLLGLYHPDRGGIRIGGIPQERLDIRWFRRHKTAVVMQETLLLSGTVTENIRFARPDASDADVREAARLANADGFIQELPEKYDTMVGERGVTLSGGQRQRLSIARAILRNPVLLVMDEPTSSLDYESERYIQEAIGTLAGGRTMITIAHRLSTIRNADRIVVMWEGGIVEEGNFEQLVKRGGYFNELLGAQAVVGL
jgi:ABC-type multidrug transport system fused ATPase/permease subunit